MIRGACCLLFVCINGSLLSASSEDSEVVFHSDVSLVHVDAQVVDRASRAITDLHVEDFVLREEGRPQPIRNFASDNVPLDVLFLLDVSLSMRSHVQRIAEASEQALAVLGASDRVGIMVFDRSTRVRLPFSVKAQELRPQLDRLMREERFNGGTDISRAMLDAAQYIRREGRGDARRTIIIITDDQTEFDRNERAVSVALTDANTVMCALIAPDAMQFPPYSAAVGLGGGGWAGPGGISAGVHTQSAGTVQIARNSGGDALWVDQASALEETLLRIRQRYTLYFSLPEGVKPSQERNVEVDLADATRLRFPDAQIRYSHVYMVPSGRAEAMSTSDTLTLGEVRHFTQPSLNAAHDAAKPRDLPSLPGSWLMQNYRFTGARPVTELTPIDPVVSELRQIQNAVLAILRKTDFAKDYESALAAAAQATANAQLIGSLERQQLLTTGQGSLAEVKLGSPIYLIALKDKTVDAATTYWMDGSIFNYLTLQGRHVMVRLDLIDRSLSSEFNRPRGLELRLPVCSTK